MRCGGEVLSNFAEDTRVGSLDRAVANASSRETPIRGIETYRNDVRSPEFQVVAAGGEFDE